jgi:hypothetical protein
MARKATSAPSADQARQDAVDEPAPRSVGGRHDHHGRGRLTRAMFNGGERAAVGGPGRAVQASPERAAEAGPLRARHQVKLHVVAVKRAVRCLADERYGTPVGGDRRLGDLAEAEDVIASHPGALIAA